MATLRRLHSSVTWYYIQLVVMYGVFTNSQELRNITLMGFLPMSGTLWSGGGACRPAIEMALKMVNGRDDLLAGYQLNYIWEDDKCDTGLATDIMYRMIYTHPVKHLILGPSCSGGAEGTARSSHLWNLTHLAWGVGSPNLSDRRQFPTFFRIMPPDTRYNAARVALLQHFHWKKVATISVAMDFFFTVTDDFIRRIKETDIEIISQEIFDRDPTPRVQNLKDIDARIIIAGSYEVHARLILCAAYKVGLYGPKVVWIFPGWFVPYWWRLKSERVSCTSEQMDAVAEGQLMTGFYLENRHPKERGIAGVSVTEFWEQFHSHEMYDPTLTMFDFIAPNCFDSIWGAAIALNCTDAALKEIGHAKTLDQFDYPDGDIGQIITACVHQLQFVGPSGRVDLSLGDPTKTVRLYQVQGSEKLTVGVYTNEQNTDWHVEWLENGIVWRGGFVPRDSTIVTIIEWTVPRSLYAVLACVAALGIFMSVSLFAFNVYHRENVSVKLSSPNINNVLLLGCVITYSTVFMHSYSSETVVLCTFRTFTFTIGFSMSFGALFSKTWRVYRIFANKKLLRVKIQDRQLIGIVGLLLAVLSVILILWILLDPLTIQTQFLENEVYLSGNDAEVLPYINECVSEYHIYFTWTIYIIEGILLVFGAFLSFETRKVKIAALNDSRLIGMCLYNVVVLTALGTTLSFVLETQVTLLYFIISGFNIVGTTATQLIVFIPKVIDNHATSISHLCHSVRIMAVYYPHRVEPDGPNTRDGTRFVNQLDIRINKSCSTPTASTEHQNNSAVAQQGTSHTPGKQC